MQIQLIFLSGSLAGTTCDVTETGATLGRGPDCDIRFEHSDGMVSGHHARVTIRDGQVLLEDENSTNGTFVDGLPVKTRSLQPGQVVMLGKDGPRARVEFGTALETPATIVPSRSEADTTPDESSPSTLTGLFQLARQQATDSASGRPPDQTAVIKAFVRLAQDQTSRRFSRRLAIVAGLALVAVVVVYALGERKAADLRGQLMAVSDVLEAQGDARTALEAQLTELAATATLVQTAVDDLDTTIRANDAAVEQERQVQVEQRASVRQDRRFGPAVTQRFAAGVGLIEFRIGWHNPDKGWLRLRGTPDGRVLLSADAPDPIAYFASSQCTGFLIDAAGWIVTNRHCVDLEFADAELARNLTLRMGEDGDIVFTPAMTAWRISFPPGRVFEIDPATVLTSPEHDLGLFRTTAAPAGVPVLPLARDQEVVAGEDVVLLAYPGGTEITARRRGVGSVADSALADRLNAAVGTAVEGFIDLAGVRPVLNALPTDDAARQARLEANPAIQLLLGTLSSIADGAAFDDLSLAEQIQPDVSGNISVSGVRPTSISYHTLGGIGGSSGGPLISADLVVIGVNHAGFADNDRGAQYQQNEAVPVAFVRQFLPSGLGRDR